MADDEARTERAVEVLEEIEANGKQCHLPDAVLCETAWVLAAVYDARKADLVTAFTALLDDPRYSFEDADVVREAVVAFETGKGGLSDYLIGLRSRHDGARTTYTFDRKLRDHAAFTVLR